MLVLFGQPENWHEQDFRAVDDRVRGGSSISHLTVEKGNDSDSYARFWGTLDTKTLGGAGFASQATNIPNRKWNLREFDGIEINIAKSDNFKYTFIIKDDHQKRGDHERSTLSYEYDFSPSFSKEDQSIYIPFSEFRPTYRGRPVEGAPPLDTSEIVQFSFMNRSFFNSQNGDFELLLTSVRAKPKYAFQQADLSEKEPYAVEEESEKGLLSYCLCQ
ncbi:mitochondrial protein complex assembly protein [Schizosaccharomyces osmophilus]|uniref:Mitochondrial protein complex assembly protein n=1 Tax=Schizosaccharomyces osmophilus TaxID=2545709 RepID=A0AAE9WDZ8_9SCHI|nr:mitochondrial protein complex assembly protein [Schizosaccharomyces osmophilus]WBW74143.1 mitochondrial protein complex assembly protein [Schizosaccharomyces osmophilus]